MRHSLSGIRSQWPFKPFNEPRTRTSKEPPASRINARADGLCCQQTLVVHRGPRQIPEPGPITERYATVGRPIQYRQSRRVQGISWLPNVRGGALVSWSLTSPFSTNMAISETKGQGWRAIPAQWRKASDILTLWLDMGDQGCISDPPQWSVTARITDLVVRDWSTLS